MAYVSTVEIPGAPAHLRRTLAPPVRHTVFDTRIRSRRATGRALQRTAVPTPVLLLERDAVVAEVTPDDAQEEAGGGDSDPDRRTAR